MKRIAWVVMVAACSKGGGGGGGAPKLVAQELKGDGDVVAVKGALPEGWTRNDTASMGGLRLETKDKDGMVTGAISIARAMSTQKAKELASDRARLESAYGAKNVVAAGVEVKPGHWATAVKPYDPRMEATVYWDAATGVVQCTVSMDGISAETAYGMCKDLEVTLK